MPSHDASHAIRRFSTSAGVANQSGLLGFHLQSRQHGPPSTAPADAQGYMGIGLSRGGHEKAYSNHTIFPFGVAGSNLSNSPGSKNIFHKSTVLKSHHGAHSTLPYYDFVERSSQQQNHNASFKRTNTAGLGGHFHRSAHFTTPLGETHRFPKADIWQAE